MGHAMTGACQVTVANACEERAHSEAPSETRSYAGAHATVSLKAIGSSKPAASRRRVVFTNTLLWFLACEESRTHPLHEACAKEMVTFETGE